MADAGIRNALALGIDRDAIVKDALKGEGEPLYLPIPPDIFGYNDELDPPKFDPDAARQKSGGSWLESRR